MSLVTEINRTNTQKENTKKVATQIDNKLVELGGERATDLFDVANKIPKMVSDNYQKVAILTPNWSINAKENGGNDCTKILKIDVPFKLGEFFITINETLYGTTFCFNSTTPVGQKFARLQSEEHLKITNIDLEKKEITLNAHVPDSMYAVEHNYKILEIVAIEGK